MFLTAVNTVDQTEPGSPKVHTTGGNTLVASMLNSKDELIVKQEGSKDSVQDKRRFPSEKRKKNDLPSAYFQ